MLNLKKYLLLLIPALSFAQEEVVMKINGKNITKGEFEYVFKKNNSDSDITKEDIDEYLDLFVNFKLKVEEARTLKYDTLPILERELNGYRKQLAKPYLIDGSITDELIKEAFERRQYELKGRHILVKVDENASPEDTAKAYSRIESILKRVKSGEDFAKVASEVSDGPSKTNGGDLGYFSAFQMVYSFETEAFKTEVGQISNIVRTRFGFHIIKIEDKRPAKGEVNVSHILVSSRPDDSEEKKANVKSKIFEIYDKLKSGEDFSELARIYSDDYISSKKGGSLGWISSGDIRPDFSEFGTQMYKIKSNKEFSEPFHTALGWHIVLRHDFKDINDFEEIKPEIEKKIKRDVTRMEISKSSFTNKLKKEYGFKSYNKSLKLIYTLVDTTIFYKKWELKNISKYKKVLFSFADVSIKQADFLNYLNENQYKSKVQDINKYVNTSYESYVQNQLIQYEDNLLEEKYPDFGYLMQEYRDGVILFEITQDSVWSKAENDSIGLDKYFNANKDKYMWPLRYDTEVYSCISKEIAEELIKKSTDSTLLIVASEINKESQLNINIENGLIPVSDREILSKIDKKVGITDIIPFNERFYVINVKAIKEPAYKKLSETRGLVISEYQKEIEKEWIKRLKAKYSVEVFKDILYSIK